VKGQVSLMQQTKREQDARRDPALWRDAVQRPIVDAQTAAHRPEVEAVLQERQGPSQSSGRTKGESSGKDEPRRRPGRTGWHLCWRVGDRAPPCRA